MTAAKRAVVSHPLRRRARHVVGRLVRWTTWRRLQLLEARLGELEARIQRLHEAVETVDYALYAPPYAADPASIRLIDEHGTTVLGFEGAEHTSESVYVAFEDVFRGSEAFIRGRQEFYVPYLAGREVIVDLGCGRGELLDLLADAGTPCIGVDSDPGSVERAVAKGHQVVQTDALSYLRNTERHALDAIVSLQFVEHIDYDELLELLRLAVSRLAPGGLFIAETVNPHSIAALRTFWVDLSHYKPIFPESLIVLCRASGFSAARVAFPCGTGDYEHDRRNAGEYAIVARAPG